MLALLLALQAATPAQAPDTLPTVTLAEALRRATGLDPNYVAALGQVDNAVWARRAAFSVFILPSVTLSTSATRNSPPFFNFATFKPEPYAVQAAVSAQYDLFTGGQKLAELTQARVALLQQESALRVSRLELGRRIGAAGAADAASLDSVPLPDLPLTLADAVTEAAEQGPRYRQVAASERAAAASYRAQLGNYLPRATLSWTNTRYDNSFFPGLKRFEGLTLSVSFPLWDNAHREIALSQARVNRDVARAIRDDMQRAVQHDVTAAYDGYVTSKASTDLAIDGLAVARENFRVQQSRYGAGATTILDLLEAEVSLSAAEAQLVQSRYASRLALAGLEAILGRRLFTTNQDHP